MQAAETGLAGMRAFQSEIEGRVDRDDRFVVLVIDVGGVLVANLGFGWDGGNAVIEEQARRLERSLGSVQVFHLGADLFAAILDGDDQSELVAEGWQLSERLDGVLREPVGFAGALLQTGSACWAVAPTPGQSADQVLRTVLSVEGRSRTAVYRQAVEVLETAETFDGLAELIACEGVSRLAFAAVRATVRGASRVAGPLPGRSADGVAPTAAHGVRVEWWVHPAAAVAARDTSSLDPIAAAIDAQVAALDRLASERHAAEHDPMTGLLNRRGFERRLRGLPPSTLVLADIDHLKQINDLHGHEAGDDAIRRLAGLLLEGRHSDVVARWGGEEFIVALPNTSIDGAARWLRRLIELGQHTMPRPISFSAGITTCDDVDGLPAALRRADEALYEAKHAGRATVRVALRAGRGQRPD